MSTSPMNVIWQLMILQMWKSFEAPFCGQFLIPKIQTYAHGWSCLGWYGQAEAARNSVDTCYITSSTQRVSVGWWPKVRAFIYSLGATCLESSEQLCHLLLSFQTCLLTGWNGGFKDEKHHGNTQDWVNVHWFLFLNDIRLDWNILEHWYYLSSVSIIISHAVMYHETNHSGWCIPGSFRWSVGVGSWLMVEDTHCLKLLANMRL